MSDGQNILNEFQADLVDVHDCQVKSSTFKTRLNVCLKRLISCLPRSFQIELKKYVSWYRIKKGTFNTDEPEEFFVPKFVSQGDWVLDIGANIGSYSLLFSKMVGPQGRVFSVEPLPDNFQVLSANVSRSPFSNVTVLNLAASETPGVVGMSIPSFSSGLDNTYMASVSESSPDAYAIALNLDSLNFEKRISLIKVDVEGYELFALKGLKKTIMKDQPIIIAEGFSEEVDNLLSLCGYDKFNISRSPNTIYYPINKSEYVKSLVG